MRRYKVELKNEEQKNLIGVDLAADVLLSAPAVWTGFAQEVYGVVSA